MGYQKALASVLAMCSHAEGRGKLRTIFLNRGVEFYEAGTWRDGARELTMRRPQVVLCDSTLPDADWKQVVDHTSSLWSAPRLIVISTEVDDSLWAEVLNLGGYDVLRRPLVEDEVVRAVGLALQNWTNERERPGR